MYVDESNIFYITNCVYILFNVMMRMRCPLFAIQLFRSRFQHLNLCHVILTKYYRQKSRAENKQLW